MAVEVNVRKRKHKGELEEDEVPKKISKKSKTPKKQKQKQKDVEEHEVNETSIENREENVDQDINESVEYDGENDRNGEEIPVAVEEEKYIKFSNDFKMLNFREKLRGSNFIIDLRHFLYLISKRPKMVAKYIEKRGKPIELAEALDRVDKTNVLHVSYVCDALQLVLMEIVSNHKTLMEPTVNACRYFLKTHQFAVDLLLKSAQLKHRRIALKLLTAIVCIDPQLGRQLLSSFDILSNVRNINSLLYHSPLEINEEETVRKCFIHFVLAYLVEGNTLLIRNIIDRGVLIRALAAGLKYDDHLTVCMVLSTLKKYVLQWPEISKTKKVHVFDVECLKSFVRLYDWGGPKVFAATNGKKGTFTSDEMEKLAGAEEREAVASAVHDFLLIVMTSRKHGIAFDSATHFREKRNSVQGKVIAIIQQPWNDDRKTELIIKTLQACPDLARHCMRHFSGIVNPLRSGLRFLVPTMNFLRKIIACLQPSVLGSALDKITLTDLSFWVKDICLPLESLVLLVNAKLLRHDRFDIRLACCQLLLTMFGQYSNYVAVIRKREQAKGGQSLRRFRFDLLNHILLNFPAMEEVMYSLFVSIKTQLNEGEDLLAHLEVILDLVLVVCREHRTLVSATQTIVEYLHELRPLYADDDGADTPAESKKLSDNVRLEMKAIRTILLLYPKALNSQEDLFSSVLKSLIKAYVYGEADVQQEAAKLLHSIFQQTGVFDDDGLEIDLWLEALRGFDSETVQAVTSMFTEVLKIKKADVPDRKSLSGDLSVNSSHLQKLFENIEKGLSVQAYVETLAMSKLMTLIFAQIELKHPLDKYLECVCLLMYHYYPNPEQVMNLYKPDKFTDLCKYMKSWLTVNVGSESETEFILDGPLVNYVPQLRDLQMAILEGSKKMEKIFENLRNERLLMIYAQQIVFVVVQLVARQRLRSIQAETAASYLNKCLDLAHQLADETETEFVPLSANSDGDSDGGEMNYLAKMLHYIFSVRLSHVPDVDLFADGPQDAQINYWLFLRTVSEHCNGFENFAVNTVNYRLKMVKAVAISLQSPEKTIGQSEKFSECIRLLQAFNLSEENCLEVMDLLARHLKSQHFFIDGGQKSVYYDLVVCVLHRLAGLQRAVQCDGFVKKFAKWYVNLCTKYGSELPLEALEEAFYCFLLVSHQYIPSLGGKFFDCMFAPRKLSKSSIRLACLLLERDIQLLETFVQRLPEHISKKELVYPLLKIFFQHQTKANNMTMEAPLLQRLYQEFKNGFMKTIEKPQKTGVIYKENVDCSIALIDHCMPSSECLDFCQKNFKFDSVEIYQMRVIQAIYAKALRSLPTDEGQTEQRSNIFLNFVNVLVQMMVIDLKKPHFDVQKIEWFAFLLDDWWKQHSTECSTTTKNFGKILRGQHWLNYCKSSLKVAMHRNETGVVLEEKLTSSEDDTHGLMLRLMAYLCERMYDDHVVEVSGETSAVAEKFSEPAQLFDMIWTHSQFYEILLDSRQTNVKTELLHLLQVLAKKSPSALQESQIPFILGSYHAKMSAADRYALALLQQYEANDCQLQKYRPFIWGESAVAFYALRSEGEERSKLTQQETSIAQVMSLIDRQTSEYTLDNFPVWRKIDASAQLPSASVEFVCPDRKPFTFGSNALERWIESGGDIAKISDHFDLRLCPKREGVYENCYDPAFFVPLMSMCFSPESYAHPARPVQNGLLAMVFAALSSQDRDMRLAAGCAQLRYRSHFEQNKFFERPLWVQAYDNIQAGLNELSESFRKHKRSNGFARVPYVSGLFVAKTFNLTTDPTHLLYKHLITYLQMKSTFNFQCVPEFNVLFYSPDVEHATLRQFIVEIIRNGIKCSSDLFLLVSTNTFKVLMGFYGSSMSSLELNLQLISTFSTCAKIPASAKIMIEHVGILPWLSAIISSVEFYQFDIIEGIISIINNLWYALQANAADFHNVTHITSDIHRLVLLLLPHLSARISVTAFAKLMNVMQRTVSAGTHLYAAMSSRQLDLLIECSQLHFPALGEIVANVKRVGGDGSLPHEAFCRLLHDKQCDQSTILALASLRAYTVQWWRSHHRESEEGPTKPSLCESLNETLP